MKSWARVGEQGAKGVEWAAMDGADPDWEYAPLRIPAEVTRTIAAAQLSLHAEFGGWELARVVRYMDGSRRITLRRRRRLSPVPLPGLIT
jgi:Family of unknown function (DUF5703)